MSACLLGHSCRYDGGSKRCEAVCSLADVGHTLIPLYEAGARIAVEKAQSSGARVAILKSKSPSCGCGTVFDGTFSGTLREGWGIAADALRDVGVRVIDENHVANLEE